MEGSDHFTRAPESSSASGSFPFGLPQSSQGQGRGGKGGLKELSLGPR